MLEIIQLLDSVAPEVNAKHSGSSALSNFAMAAAAVRRGLSTPVKTVVEVAALK
jgi:hypothetical protein